MGVSEKAGFLSGTNNTLITIFFETAGFYKTEDPDQSKSVYYLLCSVSFRFKYVYKCEIATEYSSTAEEVSNTARQSHMVGGRWVYGGLLFPNFTYFFPVTAAAWDNSFVSSHKFRHVQLLLLFTLENDMKG